MSADVNHTGDLPWRPFKGAEDEPDRWLVVSDFGYHIATIENGAPGDSLDTEEANAHLFAASPEMLEACKLAVRLLDSDGANSNSSIVVACRAAIAKATGMGVTR